MFRIVQLRDGFFVHFPGIGARDARAVLCDGGNKKIKRPASVVKMPLLPVIGTGIQCREHGARRIILVARAKGMFCPAQHAVANAALYLHHIENKIFEGAHLFTIRSISEISDSLFITESYLYEIFKSPLHISPKKYITAKRLLTAKREPDLGAAPTRIYQKTGFSSYAAFYRSYTAFFGHAPSKEKLETFSGRKY